MNWKQTAVTMFALGITVAQTWATIVINVNFEQPGAVVGNQITAAINTGTGNNFTGTDPAIVFSTRTGGGGKFAGNFSTDDNGEILTMTGFSGIPIASDYTLAFHIRRDGLQDSLDRPFDLPISTGPGVQDIAQFAANGTDLVLRTGDRGVGTVSLADGVWTHITLVHQANTHPVGGSGSPEGTTRVYVNGVLFNTQTLIDFADLPAGNITLGGQLDGGRPFTGQLDDFYLNTVALNATQVYDLWWSTVVPEPSTALLFGMGAVLLYWRRRTTV